MTTEPPTDRVTPKAAIAFKALVCIDYAARDFLEMHPETLRDKLKVLRYIVSMLNGIGQMLFPSWERRRMRYRATISDVGIAYRTCVEISETCKEMDRLPPELVERAAGRLTFILMLMNRIGRDGWLAWKDYDLKVSTGDSGLSTCHSPGNVHNRSTATQQTLPFNQD